MFEFIKKGRKLLGMNSRNLEYIRPFNLSKAKKIADNKLLAKKILHANGIVVPAMLAKIKNYEELENFDWQSLPDSFVLKPCRGFGGEGIIVVYKKKKDRNDAWIKADRSIITVEDFKNHIRNILDGTFSLSNVRDVAFFEERMQLLKLFKPYAYKGVPDIRVIVFNKIPIMAMLRLPTKESQGKANLHQGAIGVGIDMAKGVTTTAISGKYKFIEKIPDSRLILSGIKIPYWKDILTLAVRAQEISGLGFLGADIAIDKEKGPVIFELNARPGLSIQLANVSGLKERLKRVSGLKVTSIEKGVRIGMDIFGGEIEEGLEEISGRKIIGTIEKVKLIGKEGKEIEVEAKIDTGAGFSSIDTELAKQLGFERTILEFNGLNMDYEKVQNLSKEQRAEIFKNIYELADTVIIHSATGTTYRPMIRIDIIMHGVVNPSKVSIIDRSDLKNAVIIGKKNLGKFLIDVNK